MLLQLPHTAVCSATVNECCFSCCTCIETVSEHNVNAFPRTRYCLSCVETVDEHDTKASAASKYCLACSGPVTERCLNCSPYALPQRFSASTHCSSSCGTVDERGLNTSSFCTYCSAFLGTVSKHYLCCCACARAVRENDVSASSTFIFYPKCGGMGLRGTASRVTFTYDVSKP
jgi:hypothetical protein